jgi:hypothetical protein
MSTFTKTLALGLFLLANACSIGTVTGSSRIAGGGGAGAGLGPIREANSPPNVEAPAYDRVNVDRSVHVTRENPSFNVESDCWRCR